LGVAGTGRIRTVLISPKERLDTSPDVSTAKEIRRFISCGLWVARGVPKEVVNKLLTTHKTARKEKGMEISRVLSGWEHTGPSWGMKSWAKGMKPISSFEKDLLGEMKQLHE
jgi:tripartite-type tricarboxylate transporter receptor subunit TctC